MNARTILVAILIVSVLCGLALADWTEPVPVSEVNSEYDDQEAFLSFDGLTLYFARVNTDTFYWGRIYKAMRHEPYGPFTSVEEISTLNYSSGHVSGPWVSPDNLRMYYWRSGPTAVRRLKVSERSAVTDPWPEGSNISELNSLGNVGGPSLTQDELIIVFSGEGIPGGVGKYDFYIADRPDINLPFGNVRNLSEINTTSNEGEGSMSPDGLTVYFHSDHNGSFQLFSATRASISEPFGNIEHLSIFDTPGGNSAHPCISSDGTAFYFTGWISGQPWDIYVSYNPYLVAVKSIEDAIAEKFNALDKVNAALQKEWAAYEALQELLESGDYGDLGKGDIVTAMQKAYSAIQHEDLSKKTLERSIEKLQDALAALGWEPQPVSHWKFDEGIGTTAYDSVSTNDGTVYGATWTTGQINGALSFDGVNDYVDVGDPIDESLDFGASDSFSISAWIRTDADSPIVYKRICGGIGGVYDEGYNFHLLAEKLYFAIEDTSGRNAGVFGNTMVADNQWHHVAAVRDTGEDKLYLYADGSSDATPVIDATTVTLATIRSFHIGRRDATVSPGHVYFEGTMDDVRIYDRALSAQEIQQLYNNGSAGL